MNYIVISLLGPAYHGCRIVPENAIYPMIYHKVFGPSTGQKCVEFVLENCTPVEDWWTDVAKAAQARNAPAKGGKARAMAGPLAFASECRKVELARVGGIPETKVEWEGSPIPYPVLYTRTSDLIAFCEVCAPSDLLAQFWGDIANCAIGAAATAAAAAIIANPAAALPAFKAAFVACITGKVGNRVDEITVALSTQQTAGDWHRV